jgi:hypothetical protein
MGRLSAQFGLDNAEADAAIAKTDAGIKKLTQSLEEADAEFSASPSVIGGATTATNTHGKAVSGVTKFIKEQRTEQRLQNFVIRESTQMLMFAVFALSVFANQEEDAHSTTKKLTQSVTAGIGAFMGLDFALAAMGAGVWGVAIAGAIGLATAIFTMTNNAAESKARMKELKEEIDDFNKGIGLKEAQREYDITAKKIKTNEELVESLNKKIKEGTRIKTAQGMTNVFLDQKEFESINKKILTAENMIKADKLQLEGKSKILAAEKQAALERQRYEGSPEEQVKAQADADKKWFAQRYDEQKKIDAQEDAAFTKSESDRKSLLELNYQLTGNLDEYIKGLRNEQELTSDIVEKKEYEVKIQKAINDEAKKTKKIFDQVAVSTDLAKGAVSGLFYYMNRNMREARGTWDAMWIEMQQAAIRAIEAVMEKFIFAQILNFLLPGAGVLATGAGAGATGASHAGGGYTGSGNRYDIAGYVHRGEVIFEKPVVDKVGANRLLALRASLQSSPSSSSGGNYSGGGLVKDNPKINIPPPQIVPLLKADGLYALVQYGKQIRNGKISK